MTQLVNQLAATGVAAFPPLLSIEQVADIFGTTIEWVNSHSRPVNPSIKIPTKGIEVNGQIGKSMARRRYQRGQLSSIEGNWIARWREDIIASNGEVRRVRRKETIGNVKEYPTKRLAQRELDRRLKEVNAEDYKPRPQATFAEFAERWMDSVMKQHKPSSQSSEKSNLNCVLVPHFGPKGLKDITAESVQVFVASLEGSPKTARNLICTMRLVWNTARTWGYVVHDPFQGLRFPEAAKQNTYNFTVEESLAIIDAAPEQWKAFFWLLAETGMRPGELAGLKVDGIDWQAGTICIEQSVWQGKLQSPKTRAAIRTFAISSNLVQRLRKYQRDHWTRNELGLMFASKRRNPLSMDNFRNRVLNPILKHLEIDIKLKAMGIKRCGNYAFRHMNATVMDEIGTPLKTRQHRLGHARIETTMAHYTHKVDADDRGAAEAIGSMLSPTRETIM
ncbi:MAG: tyrosine-type recombinase/integrase [Terracidiphilus sp.]